MYTRSYSYTPKGFVLGIMGDMEFDIASVRHIHFVGIKGVAMAALAIFAKEKGFMVTGSDISEEFPSDEPLRKAGISYVEGFKAEHIDEVKPDLVIYTGAHNGKDNAEVQEALEKGIPVLPHGEALGMFMAPYEQISVAGSHGKTTTSGMIATILLKAGKDPSYAIGCGEIRGLGLPGHAGKGPYFVAEADEYVTDPRHDDTPRFLWQHPDVLVVTNIDYDHPDVYASIEDVHDAFVKLIEVQKGRKLCIVNADDPKSNVLRKLLGDRALTFGTSPSSTLVVSDIACSNGKTVCRLSYKGIFVSELQLIIPGAHNALNAAAAALACYEIGLSWEDIKEGLSVFGGTKRRFEYIGRKNGALVYDDYAHHPKEVAATIEAVRTWFPGKRIIVVFQAHTYSRTKALLDDFSKSLSLADIVVIPDIYASARETDTMGISAETLVEDIKRTHADVLYKKDYHAVSQYLHPTIGTGDVVVFMGAGDIYGWSKKFVD